VLAQEPQQAAVTNIINRAVPKVVGVNINVLSTASGDGSLAP
jgi:hypothetical protein